MIKICLQLVLLFNFVLHTKLFFINTKLDILKCFNEDGDIFIYFKTRYHFESFSTSSLCERNMCPVLPCENLQDGTVKCCVMKYYSHQKLRGNYNNEITKPLSLYGLNKSGSFVLSISPIKRWNFCILRKCRNTVPILKVIKLNDIPGKVDVTLDTTSSLITKNEPKIMQERILNVTLVDKKNDISVNLFSQHFKLNHGLRIFKNMTNPCQDYKQICIANGVKYCKDDNGTIGVGFNQDCRKITPYYILPDITNIKCIKSERNTTIFVEIPGIEKVPLYFSYNITNQNGEISQLKTNKQILNFQNIDEDFVHFTLCNDCRCKSNVKINCPPHSSFVPKSNASKTWIVILSCLLGVVVVCLCLVALVIWRRKGNLRKPDGDPDIFPKEEDPHEYQFIPYKPHEYSKLDHSSSLDVSGEVATTPIELGNSSLESVSK